MSQEENSSKADSSSKKKSPKKILDKVIMGAVIGGAIGSVVGATVTPKATEGSTPEKKRGFFGKIFNLFKRIILRRRNKKELLDSKEMRQIPHE